MTDPIGADIDASDRASQDVEAAVAGDSVNAEATNPAGEEDESDVILEPQISARWALAPRHLGMLAVFCLLTMILNYLPLRGTDLWGHVSYGQWIIDHGQLPVDDPFATLTNGMRLIDSAWLSQVAFAGIERMGGAEALSTTFTVLSLLYFVLISRACFLRSRRMLVAGSGLLIAVVVGFSRLTTIRPETFGALAFAVLLWLLVRHQLIHRQDALADVPELAMPRRSTWTLLASVFVVMCLWANLHGSFICGLAAIGCLFAGRVIEAAWDAWQSGTGLSAVLGDSESRKLLFVLEVAVVATLINPYGIDLLINSFGFSSNEILSDVLEWQPLQLSGIGGREFAFSWVLLTIILRHSRQRVSVGEALMVGLFALLAASRLRMIGWYAAIVAVFLAPHIGDIWSRFAKPIETEPQVRERTNPLELTRERSWTYSLVALLMIWIAFSLSPLGRPVVGDEPRTPEQIYDRQTPISVTAYLREHPPTTRVFNPQWWGDWLVWDGPEGLQPFVTTNLHLIPERVWEDYRRIMTAGSGWERAMSRYHMEMAVLDKERQARLVRTMRSSSDWKVRFEDDQAVIFVYENRSAEQDVAEAGLTNNDDATNAADNLAPKIDPQKKIVSDASDPSPVEGGGADERPKAASSENDQ